MKHRHWHHFLSIEKEIISIADHIEIDSENFKTFSVSLTKIFLSVCSEIDVLLKLLAEKTDANEWSAILNSYPKKIYPDMEVYKSFITSQYPSFKDVQVVIPLYNLSLTPWLNFSKNLSPEWWDKYNKVKHYRDKYYRFANLKNVLNSSAGLLISLLFYYGISKDLYIETTNSPKLFSIPEEFIPNAVMWEPGRVTIP
jgi:hypothetical protein